MSHFKPGELARLAKINIESLRYYEREGLLPEPGRTESGHRMYEADHIRRVRFIKRAQELGFSLREIKELLALKLDASCSAAEVKRLTEQKIQSIEEKIQSLQSMKAALAHLSNACSGDGSVDDCPILHCLDNPKKGGECH